MLIATAAVVALFSLYQYFVGLEVLRREYRRNPQKMLVRYVGVEYGGWLQRRFEKRLADQAAFGTFALSNSLAGYCAMMLPVGLGLLLESASRRRGRRWTRRGALETSALAVTVSALGAALVLSKSKGGIAAGAAALGAFVLAGAWPRLRRRPRLLVCGGVLVVLLSAGGAAALVLRVRARGVEAALGPSMRFRVDYWKGALRVIASRPLRGVGLAAFRDYYTLYKKPESPEEVLHPHNLLLGLWAIPAVIFYPVSGSLVIAGSVVVSWLLWRERVTKRQVLGLLRKRVLEIIQDKATGMLSVRKVSAEPTM